jgi:hypothetical protein
MLEKNYSILNYKRRLAKDEIEAEKSFLFDVYILVLVFVLMCNGFLNIAFLKLSGYAGAFIGMGLFVLSTLLWPDKIRFNKKLLCVFFFLLGILIFYCDIIGGKESMNYLSYILLIIAVPFFFDYPKDKTRILFLIISYFIFFFVNIGTNYSIFSFLSVQFSDTQQFYVRIYKVIEVSLCTLVGVYFISRKQKMILKYHLEKEKLNELIKKVDRISFSDGLYELAMSKNSLFITYFKSEFPDFFEKILSYFPNLIASELEICALVKINLSTKEIAEATNSTVRSVENKKYRIRRKLNIPSDIDLNLHIINTF